MRVALAARRCFVGDVEKNVRTVVNEVKDHDEWGVDLVCFPEAFLQGFDAFTGDPAHDAELALTVDSPAIEKIRRVARQTSTAVCVGFYEREGGEQPPAAPVATDGIDETCAHTREAKKQVAAMGAGAPQSAMARLAQASLSLSAATTATAPLTSGAVASGELALYSSALVIGRDGKTLAHYRRMSPGWRAPGWDESVYRLGVAPVTFQLADKRCSVALCGDLFDLPERFKAVEPQVLLWPIHRDLPAADWQAGEVDAYAAQANTVYTSVLMVNDLSGGAKGGAAWFRNGKAKGALEFDGRPDTLVVDVR